MSILAIDDDPTVGEVVTVSIQFHWPDAVVMHALGGREGLEMLRKRSPDLVLLDVKMPDVDGFDVLREIRRVSDVPVIMLTADGREIDIVRALDVGADDYVTKPFDLLELLARINAVLRRVGRGHAGPTARIVVGDLVIDPDAAEVRLNGRRLDLTAMEYRLLRHLARTPDRFVGHDELIEHVWGDQDVGASSLKGLVSRLRLKLEADPAAPAYIESERGVGYRLVSRPAGSSPPAIG